MDRDLPDRILAEVDALADLFAKQNEGRVADDPAGMAWMIACVWTRDLVQRCRDVLCAQRIEALGVGARLFTGGRSVAVPGLWYAHYEPERLIWLCEHYAWHDVGKLEHEGELAAEAERLNDLDYD